MLMLEIIKKCLKEKIYQSVIKKLIKLKKNLLRILIFVNHWCFNFFKFATI